MRWSIGRKFGAAVGAVVIGVFSVSITAEIGLLQLRHALDGLTSDDLIDVRTAGDLTIDLYVAEEAALTGPPIGSGRATGGGLLDQLLLPRVTAQLQSAQEQFSDDPVAMEHLHRVQVDFAEYLTVRSEDPVTTGPAPQAQVVALFDRMTEETRDLREQKFGEVTAKAEQAHVTYVGTQRQLLISMITSLLVALALVLLLIRNVVPRLRAYAGFAAGFAAGRPVGSLLPRGNDELAQLGRSLEDMVSRTNTARRQDQEQAEFVDTLQVTAGEEEAHALVQAHLERGLPGSTVVVLRRNNSDNRLETATALQPGSVLAGRLPQAEPRSCLALRYGRAHREDPAHAPLLSCTLCTVPGARTTCEPLLVAGQVIGSVLTTHQDALSDIDEARIRNSVAQTAPVLGNLRNLALAEFRANNDSLTGLPNKRATDDTLKRLVAQARRSVAPLAAAMIDLDHFKQVNDHFGHAKGDEVLAAVGAVLRSCIGASDFAGRFGGEELLVLLPGMHAGEAAALAERIRETIASIKVPGVDRAITASIGIADLIQHGGDAPGLLRSADRALYTAKAMGRNRVVIVGVDDPADPVIPAAREKPSRNGTPVVVGPLAVSGPPPAERGT